MKFMFKSIIFLFFLLVVSAGIGIFYLDTLAKKAIEYGGTQALGVSTSLDKIDIALLDGRTSMQNLSIANPQGFTAPALMELGLGSIAVNLKTLTEDTIVIPEIKFSNLTLNIEQKDNISNVKALMRNISSGAKTTSAQQPAAAEATQTKAGPQFIIERVILNNIKVNAKVSAMNNTLTDSSVTIPSLQLKDIGKSTHGLPLEETLQELVSAILNASINNSGALAASLSGLLEGKNINTDALKQNITEQVQHKAGAEIEKAQKQLLQNTNLSKESNDLLQQQSDQAINKLKGLFNSGD